MSSDIAISVRGLSKSYVIRHNQQSHTTLGEAFVHRLKHPLERAEREEFWALEDISFDVNQGEVLGVIGRNGAGKSTLLKVLSRITAPTRGEVNIYGRVGSLLEVGTGFHPELTGRENIYLNGSILGMRRREIDRRFDEIVNFADVEQFLDTPVKRYSSGMYVRLAFAVAAHLDTDILLVDEVLAVGDAQFQQKCLGKLGEAGQAGKSVIFISHSMDAIRALVGRCLVVEHGTVALDGPTADAVRRYEGRDAASAAERAWPPGRSPGDATARLRAVRVLNGSGAPSSQHDITDPIDIEIEYEDYGSGASRSGPQAVFHLKDDEGRVLFSSASDVRPAAARRAVRTRCRVPSNFLAEGRLSILAAVVSFGPTHVHAQEDSAVTFDVVDRTTGEGVRGIHRGPWPGLVRPALRWSIEESTPMVGSSTAE